MASNNEINEIHTNDARVFNGGKMNHIFVFDDQTKKYDKDGTFFSPEAEQALLYGTLFYKIDGSNGMIHVSQQDGDNDDSSSKVLKAYQRLDTRGKDPSDTLIALPEGQNCATYPGHSYYYDEITTNVPGKKQVKLNRSILELVQKHRERLVAMKQEWISVEWVGTKFNKTPQVPHDVAMALHDDQRIVHRDDNRDDKRTGTSPDADDIKDKDTDDETLPTIDRTYDGIRKFLWDDCANAPIEGLVVKHQGLYWKVRTDCFLPPEAGTKDPFRANRANARPPVFLA